MPGMTLLEAETYIREDILDDPDARRYTDAQVQRAVKLALSETHEEYLAQGGEQFDQVISSLNPDSSGDIDLSSYDPAAIKSVMLVTGNNYFHKLEPTDQHDKELQVTDTSLNVSVRLARVPTYPDADGEYLLQDSSNNQLVSWFAFEDLICVRAALRLCRKDNEIPAGLRADEERLRKSVMLKNPLRVRELQSNDKTWYEMLYRYYYNPQTQKISIYHAITPHYKVY